MLRVKVPPANCPATCFLACLYRGDRLVVSDCGKAVVILPDGTGAEVCADVLDEVEREKLLDLGGERPRLTRKARQVVEAWADRWHKPRKRKGRVV